MRKRGEKKLPLFWEKERGEIRKVKKAELEGA